MQMKPDFEKRFLEIREDVVNMSQNVTKAIGDSVEALKKRDMRLAHHVIADDARIDEQRFAIENACVELMAQRQCLSIELRNMVAVLSIIVELERIGDYADGIAKIVIMIGDEPPLKPLIDIPRMSEITIDMIHQGIQSLVKLDMEQAKHVASMDNSVDDLFDQVFRELLTFMMVDPKTINRATRLIWVAHNLERAADRATNICERVAFTITGKMEKIGASQY